MYEMWLDPEPDGVYLLKFFYRIDPFRSVATGDDSALMIGGIRSTEAILETCLAVAEKQEDDVIGLHSQESIRLIQELIKADIQDTTDVLGNLNQPKPQMYRWKSMVDTDTVYESENGI